MSAEFRIEGLDELDKQFDRLADTSKKGDAKSTERWYRTHQKRSQETRACQ